MVVSIVISVCASVISGMALFFMQRFFKKKSERDEQRAKDEQEEYLLVLKSIDAIGKLTYANAIAVRDGKTNGEMHEAMEAYAECRDAIIEYWVKQNVKR